MRKREKWYAQGLLPRMEARLWKDGKTVSYRFMQADGTAIQLGTDKQTAILKVAQMNTKLSEHGSLRQIWILYQASTYWKKLSERTRNDYTEYSKPLLKVFGNAHIAAIRPTHVARYLRTERANAPVRANREIALLSNLAQLAIDHGLIDVNPCKSVRRNMEMPRSTLPSQSVLERLIAWLSKQTPQRQILALAAEYASIAGNRQIEFLGLTWEQIDFESGTIHSKRAKQRGGRQVIDIITITPRMNALLEKLKQLNRDSQFVFPNSRNGKYSSESFKGLWQDCIRAAIADGILTQAERFTFHDLRAYYTTQHKNESGSLPDLHANPATTAKIYERSHQSKRSAL